MNIVMTHNRSALASQLPLPGIDDFVGYQLRRASALFGADFAAAVAGTGMRQVLVGILSVVAGEPGINQGAVGRRLGIKRANMVALINELIDSGLVDRQAGDDRRSFALALTAAGQARLGECLAQIRKGEDQRLSVLSVTEKAQLHRLLARINASNAESET